MLLIFGFRTRLHTIMEGLFHCPQCRQDRQYARRQAKQWFTLFFVPVVPMKVQGEFIECQVCHTRFNDSVLETPTTPVLADSMDKALEVIGATLRGDYAADHDILDKWVAPLADAMSVEGKEHMIAQATTQALAEGAMTTDRQRIIDTVGHSLGMTDAHIRGVIAQTESSRPAPPL